MESCIDEYDEVSEQMSQLSATDSVLENTEDCDGSETASVMEESPESREISTRSVRKVYLITYCQADLERFPSREAFANTVLAAFSATKSGMSDVLHWVCSQGTHSSGGRHYHMSVKLSHPRRWLRVRHYLDEKHGIQVNFSGNHSNY